MAGLIVAGHTNVFDYGYSFFKEALIATKTSYLLQMQNAAWSIRVALWANKSQWDEIFNKPT